MQSLRSIFQNSGVIISGDRNDLSIDRLRSIDPLLKQTVMKGTRGPNILTVVLTDLETFYEEPVIVPPIEVDNPSKGGVPSDHNGVVVAPRSMTGRGKYFAKKLKLFRPSILRNNKLYRIPKL